MTAVSAPHIWTPPRWIAMPFAHLKKAGSGHLLKTSSGHLSKECLVCLDSVDIAVSGVDASACGCVVDGVNNEVQSLNVDGSYSNSLSDSTDSECEYDENYEDANDGDTSVLDHHGNNDCTDFQTNLNSLIKGVYVLLDRSTHEILEAFVSVTYEQVADPEGGQVTACSFGFTTATMFGFNAVNSSTSYFLGDAIPNQVSSCTTVEDCNLATGGTVTVTEP